MKKLTFTVVVITIMAALAATIFGAVNLNSYWNWKCYNSYVDSMFCGRCTSPQAGDDCTAYCNSVLQVVECQYGCQYSFCDDEGW